MALGTMHFGTRLDDPTSMAILDRFAELGGQWLDTSDNYAFWQDDTGLGGASERLIGRWLAANPDADVRISTKVGAQPTIPGGGEDWRGGFPDWVEGLSDDTVKSALVGSLERLGVDRVDLYWAHVEDPSVSASAFVDTFAGLVEAGTIGAYGVSNHPSWLVERLRATAAATGRPTLSAYQQRYSYLQPSPGVPVSDQPITHGMLSSDGLELLRREPSLSGWVYTALLRGCYDRADRPLSAEYSFAGNERRTAVLNEVARERGLLPSQIVLAWLTGGDPGLTPIVGVSSPEQLDQVWQGVTTELDSIERVRLDDAG